jgi:hypothetical protein
MNELCRNNQVFKTFHEFQEKYVPFLGKSGTRFRMVLEQELMIIFRS